MEQTHSLLKRQLKRHLGDLDSLPREWQAFLEAVDTAYRGYDADRRMLERSLELSSQELLQRNSEMRTVFQAFPDLFFRLDSDGTILEYNAGNTIDLYLPPEKLVGKRIQDIPLKEIGDKFQSAIQQLKETKSLVSMEYSLKLEKQEQFYEARLLPLFENQIIVIVRNITEQKKAEEALRESEESLNLVVEGAELGTWDQNMKTGEVIRNRRWAEMLGYTLEEIEAHANAWKALIHPDDLPAVERITQDHRAGRTPFLRCEHRMRTKSGEWRWVLNCGKIIERDSEGKPIRAAGTHTDISELKRAQEALQESEKKYSTIVEKGNDGIVIIQNGLMRFANSTMAAITGFTPEEAIGKPFFDFISPASSKLVIEMYKRRMSGEELPSRYETEILLKNGKSIPVEISASLIEYEGKPADMAIIRDITERKRAEETLRESEERYKALFEGSAEGILVTDIETRGFKYTNAALCKMLGYTKEELIRMSVIDIHPKDSLQHVISEFEALAHGEKTFAPNIPCLRKDGKVIYTDISSTKVLIDGRECNVGFFTDITERKKAEEALRTSEAQLSNAMKIAQLGYWEYDVAKDLFIFNDHFYAIFRTSAEQVGGYTMSPARYAQTFLHPDDMPVVAVEMKKALETTDPHFSRQLEHRIIYADGEIGYIAVRFFIVKDDQGRTIRTYGANQDITERRRIEEELRRSENKFRTIFDGTSDGMFLVDLETRKLSMCNKSCLQMLGYSNEEFRNLAIEDLHPKEDMLFIYAQLEELTKEEKGIRHDIRFKRKDGSILFTDLSPASLIFGERRYVLIAIKDITERKKAEEALQKSEYRYRSYIQLTNQLAWVTNADGGIVEDIPEWRKYTGQSFEEIKGLGWSRALHPDDVERTMQVWLQAVKTKSAYEVEYRIRRHDGVYRNFLAHGIPVFDKDGTIQGWVGTCIDVTELKKAEENLRKSMEEAEEANRLKSEFLANMSHEIRTPMNAIIGMTGIALDTELTNEQREYLNIVKESGYSLLGLIDNILDLSKIEVGRVELDNIDFNLRAMVEGVADTLAPRASVKGLELACMIHHQTPSLFRGDPSRLRQVLVNLVGNAIKFTEKGEVVIQMELQAETEEHATLLFSVTDTGIGVPEDKTAKIFESFTQADGSTTRKYGGTGLGLSISKRLVELMKGQIGVESQPGKGSRFWFTVNLEKQTGLKEILPPVICNPQGCRILVVDDNQTNRTILIKTLESFKCVPQAVESGKKAIQILKQNYNQKEPFDLILLDMQMPEMDGEETLRLIQSDPQIKQIPVVILTSIGQRGDTARLEALGAVGYLLKPVKQSQLYDTLITILSKKKAQAESRLVPIITSHTVSEQKRQGVRLLVAEDNPMNQKLAVTLLSRAGFSVEAVENGKLAIAALKKKAYDLVFMDVQMPEMDGFEATRVIREMEGTSQHTPIIAMTAHVMKGDQERCLEAGMDDYISKPIEPETMFKVIEKWTKPSDIQERISSVQESKEKKHDPDIPLDMETALKRLDGDINLFKELMSEFLYHASEQVSILEEAVKKGDAKWVVREAHTIKGAAGNLGAKDLANSALRLEQLGRTGNLDKGENLIADLQKELERLDEYAHQSLGIESTEKFDIKTEGI